MVLGILFLRLEPEDIKMVLMQKQAQLLGRIERTSDLRELNLALDALKKIQDLVSV